MLDCIKLTKAQLDYLSEGYYTLKDTLGHPICRYLEIVAQDKNTGNILVKMKYKGHYSYEKKFILDTDGMIEKFKGNFITNSYNSIKQ